MTPEQRAQTHFSDSIAVLQSAMSALQPAVTVAGKLLADRLDAGNKILICGNGGSAADALHFSSELLNKMHMERRPLPAISLAGDAPTLTSIANDERYAHVFSKQVEALGQPGDVLVALSTSGNSANVNEAVRAAHGQQMYCLALSGKSGGELAKLLGSDDIELRAPSDVTHRIQEVHGLIIHILCDLIDHQLFAA